MSKHHSRSEKFASLGLARKGVTEVNTGRIYTRRYVTVMTSYGDIADATSP